MTKFIAAAQKFAAGEEGATLVEYGLLVGLIACVCIIAITNVGQSVKALFGVVNNALSSAAYGPEAALTLLIPLGVAGIHYILPLTVCILILLAILYFSYRQTIAAYPSGGGSYIVARENIGSGAGLLAAAALMIWATIQVRRHRDDA